MTTRKRRSADCAVDWVEIRFRRRIPKLKGLEEGLKVGGHVDQDRGEEGERRLERLSRLLRDRTAG
jgi:hypothetical protein